MCAPHQTKPIKVNRRWSVCDNRQAEDVVYQTMGYNSIDSGGVSSRNSELDAQW